jgi:hypothetical protein
VFRPLARTRHPRRGARPGGGAAGAVCCGRCRPRRHAVARRGAAGPPPPRAALDRNGDGYLSPEELRARAGTGKHRSDATEGGFAQHFRRADADGDGALTRAEAERALPRLAVKFDRIDADGDARLTPDELRRYFDARRTARGKSGESAPR